MKHPTGIGALAFLVILVALGAAALFSPRHRRRIGMAAVWAAGGVIGVYLVARGVVEFFVIHYDDPASYQGSWGGPSLAGVFLVHSGPGFLVLVAASVFAWRKLRPRIRAAGSADRTP